MPMHTAVMRLAQLARESSRLPTVSAGLASLLRLPRGSGARRPLAQMGERPRRAIGLVAAGLVVLAASPHAAFGIVYGESDGNRHPNVGAFVIKQDGEFQRVCSGTLIARDVFLTASHCTAAVESMGIEADDVWVTFDPVFEQDSELIPGTAHTHPEFGFSGPGGVSDPHDVAVILLDRWELMERRINGRYQHVGHPDFDAYLAGELEDPEFSVADMEAALERLPDAPAIA